MLVEGVTVEYRTDGGAIRGAQAAVIDYANRAANDFLAVNQVTAYSPPTSSAPSRARAGPTSPAPDTRWVRACRSTSDATLRNVAQGSGLTARAASRFWE